MEYITENKFKGILGSILGALVGGVVFCILYYFGYFASITGIIGVTLGMSLYKKFSGRMSKFGIVISVIISLAVILLAYYFSLGIVIYDVLKDDYIVTFSECLANVGILFEDSEIRGDIIFEIIMAFIFWAIGAVIQTIVEVKKLKAETPADSIDVIPVEESKDNPLDM